MKLVTIHTLMLGAAMLAPLSVVAQDPSAMPSSPMSSSQSPSTSHVINADDSSGNSAVTDTGLMKDKLFLHKVSEGGYAEVQLGQLAVQKATNEDVKKFGQRMVDAHTRLNDEFKPVAQSMGVTLATKMSKGAQAEYDKLNALSGAEFDKEYLAYMTKDHKKDMHDFDVEAASTTDPALKEAVSRGQRVIAWHLRLVAKLDDANGVPTNIASK